MTKSVLRPLYQGSFLSGSVARDVRALSARFRHMENEQPSIPFVKALALSGSRIVARSFPRLISNSRTTVGRSSQVPNPSYGRCLNMKVLVKLLSFTQGQVECSKEVLIISALGMFGISSGVVRPIFIAHFPAMIDKTNHPICAAYFSAIYRVTNGSGS